MDKLQKNQRFDVEITDTNNLGYGITKINGMVVFVNGCMTRDRCKIKLIKVAKNYAVAICDELQSPSPYRIDPACKTKRCGGCVFQNASFEFENELKRKYIESILQKANLEKIKVSKTLYIQNGSSAYRNKAQYPLTVDKNGKIKAGFFANHTHEVIPCDFCHIAPEIFSDIVSKIISFFQENDYTVYNEVSQKGLLRHLYLRLGEKTGQIMLCIVINGDGIPKEKQFVSFVNSEFPQITSIFLNINKKNTNVILSDKMKKIYGNDYIEDILCSKRFRISPLSFYQVNRSCAELLYNKAKELLGSGNKKVIDLYCGIGTVGICIASEAEKLIGVEIIPDAIKDADINAKLNNLSNCEFYAGDASSIKDITSTADAIIVDPPRKGLSKEVIQYIAETNASKVIYISCDPDTLVRDLKIFSENGLVTDTIYPVNMFPRTQHVETVVCLYRK